MNAVTANPQVAQDEFVISRLFAAPRQRVWQAWSEAADLQRWWGPKGLSIGVAELDFRPGGRFHYSMQAANGVKMWGRFVYREIVAPQRIVWLNAFSDAEGGLTRHPGSPTWPLQMLGSISLEEQAGQTLLTLRSTAFEASEEERRTFIAGFESMRQGFGGTFDQLAAYLEQR